MPFVGGQKWLCEKEGSGLRTWWKLRLARGPQATVGDDSKEWYVRASMDN